MDPRGQNEFTGMAQIGRYARKGNLFHFIGLKDSTSGLPVWFELSSESGILESSLEGFAGSEMSVVEQEPRNAFAVLSSQIIHVCPQKRER